MSGFPTNESPQSISTYAPGGPTTLPGWKSPCTSVSGTPHASICREPPGQLRDEGGESPPLVRSEGPGPLLGDGLDAGQHGRKPAVGHTDREQLVGLLHGPLLEPGEQLHHRLQRAAPRVSGSVRRGLRHEHAPGV